MAEGSSGNSFLGVIVGALLVAVLGLGYMAYTGGFGTHHTLSVNVSAPQVPGTK